MSSNLLLPVLFLPQDSHATDGNISEGQARIAFATVCLGLQAKRQKSQLREIVISLLVLQIALCTLHLPLDG